MRSQHIDAILRGERGEGILCQLNINIGDKQERVQPNGISHKRCSPELMLPK